MTYQRLVKYQTIKPSNNNPILKLLFIFLTGITMFISCSSPEYTQVVKEKIDGSTVGLAPEIIITYSIKEKGYFPQKYQDFHLNSNTHLIGSFKGETGEPIRIDTWKEYHSNGTLFAEGKYKENQKEKTWNYYYDNEEKAGTGKYENDRQKGKWKFYYKDGKKSQVQHFQAGELNGIYDVWFENSNKYVEGYYSNNKPDSSWIRYYDTEGKKIYYQTEYKNGSVVKYSVLYEDGSPLAEGGTYTHYSDKNGLYKLWYPNGKQAYEESFTEGAKNGNARYWDENGNMIYQENLSDNKLTVESGNISIVKTYSEDLSKLLSIDHSHTISTDSNSVFKGKDLQITASMENKQATTGKWTAKYLDGTLAGKIQYKDGNKIGNWQLHKPSGKLISKIKYDGRNFTEAVDINGYKWVVTNGKVTCPNGKKIQARYLFDRDCDCGGDCADKNVIILSGLDKIKTNYSSIEKSLGKANREIKVSLDFNLDYPSPMQYDIENPILSFRLPFKIDK